MEKNSTIPTSLPENTTQMEREDRFMGAIVGLAVGDALGAPYEFKARDSFQASPEYETGGAHDVLQGEWTDDTSMALCAAESLLYCKTFDPADMMSRWHRWMTEGYMSTRDHCFDIGITTSEALNKFGRGIAPNQCGVSDPRKAGNGSLMRLAPIPLYSMTHPALALDMAVESSRLTHAAPACLDACHYFAGLLLQALSGIRDKETLLSDRLPPSCEQRTYLPEVTAIAQGTWKTKARNQIASSGYVLHTLEAALWCFYHTDNFQDGALMAVNLGSDTDTTGAVYGQIAGAYYGLQGIPPSWLDKLMWKDQILDLAKRLLGSFKTNAPT